MTKLEKLSSWIENRGRQARVVFDIKYRMGDELGLNA